jgi:pimeloyl-ACP methyl ester carboxylesterase
VIWLAAIVAALLLAAWLLHQNARRYTDAAHRRWPPGGRFLQIEDASIHVVERGPTDAPRVLLIHGASANLLEVWQPLAPLLEADHRVIAFDRPGYGHSTRPRRAASLALQAKLAARVLDDAGGEAIVVAHSLGAAVALRLAIDRPDLVSALVLAAPASHPYPGKNAWWARLAATPVLGHLFSGLIIPWVGPVRGDGGMKNTFAPAPVPEGYFDEAGVGLIFRPRAFRASALDVVATNREFAAQIERYPDIVAPTIIITADEDRVVSPRIHSRVLASELQAAELVTAPGAGHMPHRIRTDLVIAAIRRVQAMATVSADD